MQRDPALREHYCRAALADIPRLLGAVDRNPYHASYGCLDRSYWHYRTSSFPSEMFQEGVLPLALVYARPLPMLKTAYGSRGLSTRRKASAMSSRWI